MVIKLLKKKLYISLLLLFFFVLSFLVLNNHIFENFNIVSNDKFQIDDEINLLFVTILYLESRKVIPILF